MMQNSWSTQLRRRCIPIPGGWGMVIILMITMMMMFIIILIMIFMIWWWWSPSSWWYWWWSTQLRRRCIGEVEGCIKVESPLSELCSMTDGSSNMMIAVVNTMIKMMITMTMKIKTVIKSKFGLCLLLFVFPGLDIRSQSGNLGASKLFV